MSAVADLWRFLYEYFIHPMYTRSGYNPINTLVYALAMGFGFIAAYRYVIKPLRIKIDGRFFLAVTPMIVFGATVRALVDGGVLPENPWLLTPGIFFTATLLFGPVFVLDAKLKTYPKISFTWGLILALWANYLFVTHAKDWRPYELTLLHTAVSWAVVLAFYRWKPFDRLYLYAVLAHYFDVASTVVGIHFYGYHEVHWVEHYLVQWFGAYVYYPWITFILVVVYWVINNFTEDEDERHLWYLLVYILGLGPAIRDPAQMVLQV
jgi:uncharacterized membrane protein